VLPTMLRGILIIAGWACPVHGELLRTEQVPILYGLYRHPSDYHQARKELFPRANAVAYGGCLVGPRKLQAIRYCEACRIAMASWASETGLRSGLPPDSRPFFARHGSPAKPGAIAHWDSQDGTA
jgi:hypothetical protein